MTISFFFIIYTFPLFSALLKMTQILSFTKYGQKVFFNCFSSRMNITAFYYVDESVCNDFTLSFLNKQNT